MPANFVCNFTFVWGNLIADYSGHYTCRDTLRHVMMEHMAKSFTGTARYSRISDPYYLDRISYDAHYAPWSIWYTNHVEEIKVNLELFINSEDEEGTRNLFETIGESPVELTSYYIKDSFTTKDKCILNLSGGMLAVPYFMWLQLANRLYIYGPKNAKSMMSSIKKSSSYNESVWYNDSDKNSHIDTLQDFSGYNKKDLIDMFTFGRYYGPVQIQENREREPFKYESQCVDNWLAGKYHVLEVDRDFILKVQ